MGSILLLLLWNGHLGEMGILLWNWHLASFNIYIVVRAGCGILLWNWHLASFNIYIVVRAGCGILLWNWHLGGTGILPVSIYILSGGQDAHSTPIQREDISNATSLRVINSQIFHNCSRLYGSFNFSFTIFLHPSDVTDIEHLY
ncbi:hypothetical protein [Moorena producens]|uniref:hypothetical protein n=1 Tax=Moorena producens TaxID=1155739 RepID=UPI0011EA6C64|nr:hypothetical protein [Moorena producens]